MPFDDFSFASPNGGRDAEGAAKCESVAVGSPPTKRLRHFERSVLAQKYVGERILFNDPWQVCKISSLFAGLVPRGNDVSTSFDRWLFALWLIAHFESCAAILFCPNTGCSKTH